MAKSTMFTVPPLNSKQIYKSEFFRGVDLFNAPENVDSTRSPNADNIIRGESGKLRKRTGFNKITFEGSPVKYSGTIHRASEFASRRIVHAGTSLYDTNTQGELRLIKTLLNDGESTFIPRGDSMLILDGKRVLKYTVYSGSGYSVNSLDSVPYVPTVVISRSPGALGSHTDSEGNTVGGGGKLYEPFNLISSRWKESFCSTADATVFKLTKTNIDSIYAVEVMNGEGEFSAVTEGYTVDSVNGTVTFEVPPGAPVTAGTDNVRITAVKNDETLKNKINKCTVGAFYGVGGKANRLFLGGNPDYPSTDFFSAFEDFTYFPDVNYSMISTERLQIKGYMAFGKYLVTFLSSEYGEGSAVMRYGETDSDNLSVFPVVNTLIGCPACSSSAFAYLDGDPLFLTSEGVFAITASDVSGGTVNSLRSLYVTPLIKNASTLSQASAVVYNGFYVLSLEGKLILLDGTQKSYSPNAPHSEYQYECYICSGIPANTLWTENGALCFGDTEGYIYSFAVNPSSPDAYNDCSQPICAFWETPDICQPVFFKKKTFTYVSAVIASEIVSGIKIYAKANGLWYTGAVYNSFGNARYLDFTYIDIMKFSFSADKTAKSLGGKIRLRNLEKIRFRLENSELNEPFGIYAFAVEYFVK